MAIAIRPVMERQREFEITHRLVAAIAKDLRRLCGTNRGFQWRKVERRLQQIVSETRRQPDWTADLSAPPRPPAHPMVRCGSPLWATMTDQPTPRPYRRRAVPPCAVTSKE
jgi:hypothetical protein